MDYLWSRLQTYQKNPEHVAVAERIKDMAKERAVVDFEQ